MRSTEQTVRAVYHAFQEADKQGMLAQLDEDVEVRFLGARTLHGKQETAQFLDLQEDMLHDLHFEVIALLVDGPHAAGVWRETATTAGGRHWDNHGVDVFGVREGRVVSLHEHNDVRRFYEHLPDNLKAHHDQANAAGGVTDHTAEKTSGWR
jgi:ketosteroid isomerase-like protein